MTTSASRPLFDAYPALRDRVSFILLADLPTPLEPLRQLSAEVGAEIRVKRDGLSHPLYGGNRIRKFEFVFGDILRSRAQAALTGGGLGSHHTLATAVIVRVILLDCYMGLAYAHPTDGAQQAVELLARLEGLPMETTYTGRTVAAVLDHARENHQARLLFVDTFAERPNLAEGNYHALPERLWPVSDSTNDVGCWCLRASRDPGFYWRRS